MTVFAKRSSTFFKVYQTVGSSKKCLSLHADEVE